MSAALSSLHDFLAELRRRHVVRVAIVYGVIAWIVVEAASVVLPALTLPLWTTSFVVILAILGFPIAIVLAWAFEITPEGVRLTESAARGEHERQRPALAKSRAADGASLVVLPFVNVSGDPENEYFSDGITDDIINGLSKIGAIKVISRTSAMRYKGGQKTLREIGDDLGVSAVLEGSVRYAGNRVRIVAQLIDAKTDEHLWADTYDRELVDIFGIQSDVAERIAGALRAELSAAQIEHIERIPTDNLSAYNLFLKGRHVSMERTAGALKEAIDYYERAINEDSAYALAYAGLADAYVMLCIGLGAVSAGDAMPRAKAAAQRALEIDNTLAEAHTSLAYISLMYDWDWATAASEFKSAIEFNPGYALAHHDYALYLAAMGRLEEGLGEERRALQLDPFSLPINVEFGRLLHWSGQNDVALQRLKQAVKIDDNFAPAFVALGEVYSAHDMHTNAISAIKRAITLSGGNPVALARLGQVYARAARDDQAVEIIGDLEERAKRGAASALSIARVYASLGDRDSAFEWLEKACEDRRHPIVFVKVDPVWEGLRSDERFGRLLNRLALP